MVLSLAVRFALVFFAGGLAGMFLGYALGHWSGRAEQYERIISALDAVEHNLDRLEVVLKVDSDAD